MNIYHHRARLPSKINQSAPAGIGKLKTKVIIIITCREGGYEHLSLLSMISIKNNRSAPAGIFISFTLVFSGLRSAQKACFEPGCSARKAEMIDRSSLNSA